MKLWLALVSTLSVLALAACGAVQPGSAAIVNGHKVSQADVEVATLGFCAVGQASQGQGLAVAEASQQALQQLVIAEIADQLAAERGISVSSTDVPAAEREQLRAQFGDSADAIIDTLELLGRISPIAAKLGEAQGLESDEALQAGFLEIEEVVGTADISFNPQYGVTSVTEQPSQSSSLSVAEVADARQSTHATACR